MKILRYYLLTAVIALASLMLYSCSKSFLPEDMSDVLPTSTSEEIDFNVSLDAATKMAEILSGGCPLSSIKPYARGKDTLFYIANYSDGWKLISADKRLSPILAEDNTGNFKFNPAIKTGLDAWTDDLSDSIQQLKHTTTVNEDNKTVSFWNAFASSIEPTQFGDPTDTSEIGTGYRWARIDRSVTYVTDSIITDHIIPTVWGEGSPWNCSFPPESTTTGPKLKARPMAVAIAQLLYYCHYELGKPTALRHGSAMSYTASGSHITEYHYLEGTLYDPSPRWDDMPLIESGSNINYVSEFLMDVGHSAGVSYTSWDIMNRPNVSTILPFGIICNKTDYNKTTVDTYIEANSPVMICAAKNINPETSSYTNYWTWLIDGKLSRHHQRVQQYEWTLISHLDFFPSFNEPGYTYYTEAEAMAYNPNLYSGMMEVVSTTEYDTEYYLMNWGSGSGNNSGIYLANTAGNYTYQNNVYQYDKKILFDFR